MISEVSQTYISDSSSLPISYSANERPEKKESLLETLSDHELYEKVQADECYQSFKILYEKYYNRLLFFSRKYLDNLESSEEVVNEVFVKIWCKRQEIQINDSFKSYIYTSVRNKCLDTIRKESNRQFESDYSLSFVRSTYSNTIEIIQSNELFNRIEEAIQRLPKDRRRIFLMSRNEGMKYKEIANELGISIKTVETQMGRSLRYLRDLFKEDLKEFCS